MTTIAETELVLRSLDATWNRTRWETLPDDGNRYEVIDGVLYMTTAPSSFHQWIAQQIFLMLYRQIDTPRRGITFMAPIGVLMPGCDPVQPDLVVVPESERGMLQNRRIIGVPALLVEIVSPSSLEQDTHIKRTAYARGGVPEYWIVRPATRDMLVCSQPDPVMGDYLQTQRIAPEGELISPTLPVRIQIADFFAGAPDTTI